MTPRSIPINAHILHPLPFLSTLHPTLSSDHNTPHTMSRQFSVTEPHPSVGKTGAYISGGRGGAGNFRRYQAAELTAGTNATGPAARLSLNKSAPRTVTVGRGGAGNLHTAPSTEEPIFQFDEEISIARRESQAPIYHIGRGGAANWVDENRARNVRPGSSSSITSTTSNASTDGAKRSFDNAIGKLQRTFSRR